MDSSQENVVLSVDDKYSEVLVFPDGSRKLISGVFLSLYITNRTIYEKFEELRLKRSDDVESDLYQFGNDLWSTSKLSFSAMLHQILDTRDGRTWAKDYLNKGTCKGIKKYQVKDNLVEADRCRSKY